MNVKHAKMLGLLALAAAALMAFAGSASATVITSPTGTVYTGQLTAESEGTISLDGSFPTVSCNRSHIAGNITGHGESVTVTGDISTLSFTECNFAVTVEANGTLELHAVTTKESPPGSGKFVVENCPLKALECTGTLTSTGAKVKVHTSLGECVFTTTNTDIGLLTPSNDVGLGGKDSTATIDIGAHGTGKIPRTGGSFLCGSTGQWTGAYIVPTPDRLYVDQNTN